MAGIYSSAHARTFCYSPQIRAPLHSLRSRVLILTGCKISRFPFSHKSSSRVADHDADVGLLCCPNRALRRGVYSSLHPRTRPRHSSGKACRARRSEGNRVTTVDRSGRQVNRATVHDIRKESFGRVPEQCVWFPVRKEQKADRLTRPAVIRRCRNRSHNPQLAGNPMPFLVCAAPPR
jgi:hypothetical protein